MRFVRRAIGRGWLAAFGWTLEGSRPPGHDRLMIIAYPHTSSWDFPFAIAVSWTLDLKINWLGKHTLFRGLRGSFFRVLGGIPVDRRGAHDVVKAMGDALRERERFVLTLAPEGTRKSTEFWKSGFYAIAYETGVPIVLGFIDFEKKRVGLGPLIEATGDVRADMDKVRAFYEGIRGKYPDQAGRIRLRAEEDGVWPPKRA